MPRLRRQSSRSRRMKCIEAGCMRSPRRHANGRVDAHCDAHTRSVLRDAFGPESAPSALTRSGGTSQRGAAEHAVPATHAPASLAVTKASPAH